MICPAKYEEIPLVKKGNSDGENKETLLTKNTDGVIIATTGKSAGEWVATGIDYAAQKAVDTYRWMAAH